MIAKSRLSVTELLASDRKYGALEFGDMIASTSRFSNTITTMCSGPDVVVRDGGIAATAVPCPAAYSVKSAATNTAERIRISGTACSSRSPRE